MKARKLKEILNNTRYIIGDYGEYIGVGSSMCHKLINIDKKSLEIKYALDYNNSGRAAINHEELLFIWDKLNELIENGILLCLIQGKDVLENPLPVFTIKDGKLIEESCEEYGWPNTTDNGCVMYDNTYFKTKIEAIEYGIKEYSSALSFKREMLEERLSKLDELQETIWKYKVFLANLRLKLDDIKEIIK